MWQLKLLQENIANLEWSINKIANTDRLEMLESPSHHAMRCSDKTVKRALQIQSATGESYKGKLGLQQLTMVWMWKKVNELKDDVSYCSSLLYEVYIYIYIRFNFLPLQQHRLHFKQHCICNLNILRWNPKQQLRVTLNGYFTIHLSIVNVVAPFRQNVNLCCAVTRSQTKANSAEILGKIVYVIILAPLPSLQKQPKQRWLSISFVNRQTDCLIWCTANFRLFSDLSQPAKIS